MLHQGQRSFAGRIRGSDGKSPIQFSWLAYDRVEGKVRQDWEIFKEIEAKTGVSVDFQIVSQEGLIEKRQIMIATNSVTDFIRLRPRRAGIMDLTTYF